MRLVIHGSLVMLLAACGANQSEPRSSESQSSQNAPAIHQSLTEQPSDTVSHAGAIDQQSLNTIDLDKNIDVTKELSVASEQTNPNADQAPAVVQDTRKLESMDQPKEKPDSKS